MNLTTYLGPQTYDIEEIWPKLIFPGGAFVAVTTISTGSVLL